MKHNKSLFLKTAAIAIVLNVVLSQLLSTFATPEEVKPSNGAANLPLKSQISMFDCCISSQRSNGQQFITCRIIGWTFLLDCLQNINNLKRSENIYFKFLIYLYVKNYIYIIING